MARGNRKSTIFHDDDDRWRFLSIVARAVAAYNLLILAMCLMSNHYHIVLETPEGNLSRAMHFINGVFAQRSNRRHRQTGHVFEGRFRSLIIQRESYLMRAARYVVRNPVRAGLVHEAAAWPWSSYRAMVGLAPVPKWLHVEWMKWAFATDSLADARRRYADYVDATTERRFRIDVNGAVFGSKEFRMRVFDACRVPSVPSVDRPLPAAVRATSRPSLPELFEPPQASAASRNQCIYDARMEHGYSFSEIAQVLGIDRSTASKAAGRHQRTISDVDCNEPGSEI
jgi:REP element-mobilizing transposase RayT